MHKRMPLVYVAGPYRANSEWQILSNIREAEALALEIWRLGGAALCPHKNTALFGGAFGIPDDTWLAGDLEMLRCCAMLVCTERWAESTGARAEVQFARDHGIPVFEWPGQGGELARAIRDWIAERELIEREIEEKAR